MVVAAAYAGGSFAAVPSAQLRVVGYDGASALGRIAGGGGGANPSVRALPGYGAGGPMQAAGWPSGFGGGRGGSGGGNGAGGGGFGKLIGGMMVEHAGKDMLGMLGKPIDEAAKYQQAVARFELFGLGDKLNAEAIKLAKGMNIFGTSMTAAMNDVTEAQGVFRESGLSGSAALAGAKLAAPFLAKMEAANSGLDSETQAKMHTQGLDMLRFIEMRGGLASAAKFNAIGNEGFKAIRSSGGNVNWSQLRQFMATAGVAAQGMTDKALFGEMEPVIGELKGGAAGHAFMTAYSRLNGLVSPIMMNHIMKRDLIRLGLWDKSKVVLNKQGMATDFVSDPLLHKNLFSSSPYHYYKDVVLPAYTKAGITAPQDKYRENALLFGNTGGKMFSIIDRQLKNIELSVDAQKKTLEVAPALKKTEGTMAGQIIDFDAKKIDALITLGTQLLPMLISGLKWLNPILKDLSHWIESNKTLVKGLVIGFAALAGAMMIGGTVTALSGAFTLVRVGFQGLGLLLGGGGLLRSVGALAGRFGGLLLSGVTKLPMILGFLGDALMWVGRALLTNPIGIAIMAVAAAGIYIYRHWATIGPYVMKVWHIVSTAFREGIQWIWGAIQSVWKRLEPFAKLYMHIWGAVFDYVVDGVSKAFHAISNIITKIWDYIANSPVGKAIGWVKDKTVAGAHAVAAGASAALDAGDRWATREDAKLDGPKNSPIQWITPPALPRVAAVASMRMPPAITKAPAANDAPKASPYVATRKTQTVQVNSTLTMDGRAVGKAVTTHVANEAARPQSGRTNFDPTAAAPPIGLHSAF